MASSIGVSERVRRSVGDLSKAERMVARTLLSGPPRPGVGTGQPTCGHCRRQLSDRVDGVERVRLRLSMAVGIGPSRDDIWLTGDPDLHLGVPLGLHGDLERRPRW